MRAVHAPPTTIKIDILTAALNSCFLGTYWPFSICFAAGVVVEVRGRGLLQAIISDSPNENDILQKIQKKKKGERSQL